MLRLERCRQDVNENKIIIQEFPGKNIEEDLL
jgi:hypothetical protein